jgi:sensor histidine kinase regulating citrate/malate metabolism
LSKKEKIVKRLLSHPVDFSFAELTTLLGLLGYSLSEAGKTSGSRVVFIKDDDYIRLHKPHPGNILKRYQVDDIIAVLKERGMV